MSDEALIGFLQKPLRAMIVVISTAILDALQSHQHYRIWPLLIALFLLSLGNRTVLVALIAPAYLMILVLVPPEMAANIAAWLKAASG